MDRGISPRVTGTVDLGSASKAWRKLYLSDDGLAAMQNDFSSDAAAHNSIYRGKELPYTWAEIQAKVQAGDFSDLYIGDYKEITLTTDEVMVCEIAGIDRDYKSGASAEGQGHHIDFISRDCLSGGKRMRATNTNNGTASEPHPWLSSELYETLNDASTGVYNTLPSDLKSVIVDKYIFLEERYSSGGSVSADTGWTTASAGKLWIPSEVEVFGHASWSEIGRGTGGYGCNKQYSIFALNPSRISKGNGNGGERAPWWLMSVFSVNTTSNCRVEINGTAYATSSNNDNPCAPLCFRIG